MKNRRLVNLDLLAYILKLRVPGWDSQYTQGAWGALRLIFLGLQKFFVNSVSMANLKRNFEVLPPAMSFNNEGLIPQQPTNQPTSRRFCAFWGLVLVQAIKGD